MMGTTASQVRQDFNCFGGFGQQGIGYKVDVLRAEIGSCCSAMAKTAHDFGPVPVVWVLQYPASSAATMAATSCWACLM